MSDEPDVSLSQIETRWSLVFRAHREEDDAASALRELILRYARAVLRYLRYVTRDDDAADDLAQEFALRFLRGDFRRADPRRGRFRHYVKSALLNLAVDAQRRRKTLPLPEGGAGISSPPGDLADLDRAFLDCWRDEVLRRAWERLDAAQKGGTGPPFYTVLRFRADHPEMRSPELAERLSALLGRPVSAVWVRQNLRRARERFVSFLQAEVAHSLGRPTAEERDEEMRDLGLWSYCRPAGPD